jgi:flavin reductase (DIM6/NTAB) family NADH-FMN oxidoreductase RutF
MTLDPGQLSPQDCYKILVGAVVPRPIAFVSSLSASGVRNLAPFSFFTVASSNPPVIVFQNSIRGDGTAKDTVTNVRATGEFVVNVVSEDFAAAMNLTSGDYPPDVDEFALSGLTPIESEVVKPQRVGESHVQMECKLLQIVEVSDKPLGGALVLGEVVRFHLSDTVANDKLHIDPEKLRAIGRMAGTTYARTTDRFDMKRP